MKICYFILITFWCVLYIPGRSYAIQDEEFVNQSLAEDSSDITQETVEINAMNVLNQSLVEDSSDITRENVEINAMDMLRKKKDKGALPPARNCLELKKQNYKSGTYLIKPCDLSNKLVNVYCDMDTKGGGWTVLQRRDNYTEQEDFYNTWYEYAIGFGDASKDHWIGNDNIHCLTEQGHQEIRFDLEDFDGNTTYASYGFFYVDDRSNLYQLRIQEYAGDAGDALLVHNNMKFSTHDADYDSTSSNCAASYKGGWWYNACHHSNLNGMYLSGSHSSYADGVNWYEWKGYNYSLKKSEMKIRAKN